MSSFNFITKRIVISDLNTASNIEFLKEYKIDTIINVSDVERFDNLLNKYRELNIEYYHLQLTEEHTESWTDIENVLKKTNEILNNKINNNVLIHCLMGQNRSATVLVYDQMIRHGISFEEALKIIQNKRPSCYVMDRYAKILKNFDDERERNKQPKCLLFHECGNNVGIYTKINGWWKYCAKCYAILFKNEKKIEETKKKKLIYLDLLKTKTIQIYERSNAYTYYNDHLIYNQYRLTINENSKIIYSTLLKSWIIQHSLDSKKHKTNNLGMEKLLIKMMPKYLVYIIQEFCRENYPFLKDLKYKTNNIWLKTRYNIYYSNYYIDENGVKHTDTFKFGYWIGLDIIHINEHNRPRIWRRVWKEKPIC